MINAPKYIRLELESYRKSLRNYKLEYEYSPTQELHERIWQTEDMIAMWEDELHRMGEPLVEELA